MSGIADDRVPREWAEWFERHRPPNAHIPVFYETTRRLARMTQAERAADLAKFGEEPAKP